MANLPKHVTTEEIAESLNCSKRTVQRMVRTGEIPAVKLQRQYRFDPQAVEMALSRGERARDRKGR